MVNSLKFTVFVLASTLMLVGSVKGDLITFDDAWVDLGQGGDPANYYSSLGVGISGTYYGAVGGIGNGDPGNWGLQGTNGSAFLGINTGVGSSQTFAFSSVLSAFSIDVGIRSGSYTNNYELEAFLGGSSVGVDAFTVSGGQWITGTVSASEFDSVTVTAVSGNRFAWGLDNVQFSSIPEPASSFAIGIGMLMFFRRKRSLQMCS